MTARFKVGRVRAQHTADCLRSLATLVLFDFNGMIVDGIGLLKIPHPRRMEITLMIVRSEVRLGISMPTRSPLYRCCLAVSHSLQI